jgi:hypothetical protein
VKAGIGGRFSEKRVMEIKKYKTAPFSIPEIRLKLKAVWNIELHITAIFLSQRKQ